MMDHDLELYLPRGTEPDAPLISPLRAQDVRSLPPAYIHTAEYDPMRDEGHGLCGPVLQQLASTASYTCHPGMIHLFYAMTRVIPYASPAIQRLGGAIKATFGAI